LGDLLVNQEGCNVMRVRARNDYIPTPAIGPVLARLFSSSVLKEIAHTGHSTIAGSLVRQRDLFNEFESSTRLCDFYDTIFKRLTREYRHEYVYKNAVAEKILLGRHSLNTAFMLTEFRVDDCKADVVVLNGTSHVYEIKSEMDSFDRLDRQLAAYRKIFEYITVVTTEHLFESVQARTPEDIGIKVLADGGYQFRKYPCRESISNRGNIDSMVVLSSLQRHEYLKIIEDKFGVSLKEFPNTHIYNKAKSYFERLHPNEAHDSMVEILKERRNSHRFGEFVSAVPNSLKAAALSIRLTKEERYRFIDALNKNIRLVFN
jgi:hypothetical protein